MSPWTHHLCRGRQDGTATEISEENRSAVRKQTSNNSIRLPCKRWSISCRISFSLLLESCNHSVSRSLRGNCENGTIVFVSSQLINSCVASVNPEFGATTARHLNQRRVCGPWLQLSSGRENHDVWPVPKRYIKLRPTCSKAGHVSPKTSY